MQVNSVNNSQTFQSRIKINKSNVTKIATSASLGTTALASMASQADFDYGMSQQIAGGLQQYDASKMVYSQNKPESLGSTFDWSINASDYGAKYNTEPGSPERTNEIIGEMGVSALTSQLSGYSGYDISASSVNKINDLEMTNKNQKLPS